MALAVLGTSLTIQFSVGVEAAVAVKPAPAAATEFAAAIRPSWSAVDETMGGVCARPTPSAESLSALAAAVQFGEEIASSARVSILTGAESAQGVAATPRAAAEATAALVAVGHSGGEIASGARASILTDAESAQGVAATPRAAAEAASGLLRSFPVAGEAALAAGPSARAGVEAAGGVLAIARLAAEIASSARVSILTGAESAQGVAIARAAIAEALAITSIAVTADSILALEFGAMAVGSARGALESAAGLRTRAALSGELSVAVMARALGALEFLSGVKGLVGDALEFLSFRIQADARFVDALNARAFASAPRDACFTPRRFVAVGSPRRFTSRLELTMPQGPDFSVMDVGETVNGAVDFGRWLGVSETISRIVSVTADIPTGSSGACAAIVGSPQVGTAPVSLGGTGAVNKAVLQQWTGLAPGVARITATITTSLGQTLIGWAHQPVATPN